MKIEEWNEVHGVAIYFTVDEEIKNTQPMRIHLTEANKLRKLLNTLPFGGDIEAIPLGVSAESLAAVIQLFRWHGINVKATDTILHTPPHIILLRSSKAPKLNANQVINAFDLAFRRSLKFKYIPSRIIHPRILIRQFTGVRG